MQLNKLYRQSIDTPWKAINEMLMYLCAIPAFIFIKVMGIKIGTNPKFYGLPVILKHRGSSIEIGDRFENRNWKYSNPLGVNHSLIISTWKKSAKILIGNDVGITGGSIIASEKIEIGNGTLIGANTTIIDTDFHPLGAGRRYSTKNVRSKAVKIGSNVFIGMNSIILKGSIVPNNAIVPAGSVVRSGTKFSK